MNYSLDVGRCLQQIDSFIAANGEKYYTFAIARQLFFLRSIEDDKQHATGSPRQVFVGEPPEVVIHIWPNPASEKTNAFSKYHAIKHGRTEQKWKNTFPWRSFCFCTTKTPLIMFRSGRVGYRHYFKTRPNFDLCAISPTQPARTGANLIYMFPTRSPARKNMLANVCGFFCFFWFSYSERSYGRDFLFSAPSDAYITR